MRSTLDDKEFHDFSNYEHDSFINYGGSDQKGSIIIGEKRYMLKYANHEEKYEMDNSLATSNVNNVLSEYVGSHIVSTLGLEVQNTFLGESEGRLLVACENFLKKDEYLLEFGNYLNQMYTSNSIGRIPTYDQIYNVIQNHLDLSKIYEKAIEMYWNLFIADALIGNFDRHRGNWGYIYNLNSKTITCSPIYDCGSSLFPNLSEKGMLRVLSNEKELLNRVYSFPRAALIVGGKNKVSYYDMLSSGYDKYCVDSLLKIAPKIDLKKIKHVIDYTPQISDIRKLFYLKMIEVRKELIINRAYNKIVNNTIDNEALKRVKEGTTKQIRHLTLELEMSKIKDEGWDYTNFFTDEEKQLLRENKQCILES